jgi:hypothetical protein
MKLKGVIRSAALVVFLLTLVGCTISRAAEGEKMYILGSALSKLSASVESTVRYKDPEEGISDAELLVLATRHDPGLLEPFADYKIRILRQDKHAVVLVCTKDGNTGLLEDAGCSSEFDRHLWKEEPPNHCEFTVKVQDACPSHKMTGE